MNRTQRQRELYFTHIHDSPPIIDLGMYYDVKEITEKLSEYGYDEKEIKRIIKKCGRQWLYFED